MRRVDSSFAGTTSAGRGKRGGFTLIELIIVLTILAVLSAGVVPVFNGTFGTVQSDHSTRDFAAMMRFGQERAVTDSVEYRLYLNPELGTYGLARLKEMDGENKVFEPVAVRQQERVQLPGRVTLKASRAKKDKATGEFYVAFYASGACDDAKIDFVRGDGKTSSVTTQGGMGRLKVSM